MTDADLRYAFSCPKCSGSFSISLERIPPVKARFSCPRCGTSMEFPSRDEARVYMALQDQKPSDAPFPSPSEPTDQPEPPPPAPPKLAAAPPPAPKQTVRAPAPPPPAERAEQKYTVSKVGFEGDVFDRRAVRILIRTGALNPSDSICVDGAAAVRADQLPDLNSLFELRKNARFKPPAVCPKHIDALAHHVCATSRRPLCEACAEEKKFGGTSVRVCAHCGGTVEELPIANE